MLRLLLITCLVFTSGAVGSSLGKKQPLKDWSLYIINGEEAAPGEFPSQVSSHSCGASIISADWALTASHCVDGRSPSQLRLLAGTNDLTKPGTYHQVSTIIMHDDYDSLDSWVNDIAVMRVATPFVLDALRQPIRLPQQDANPAERSKATVIGWGRLQQGGALPTLLQKVDIEITPQSVCENAYNGIGYDIYATHICADVPEGNKGSCQGDSGGPLTVDGVVVGLVSWAQGCATPGYSTVYTRVPSYRNWIREKTGV